MLVTATGSPDGVGAEDELVSAAGTGVTLGGELVSTRDGCSDGGFPPPFPPSLTDTTIKVIAINPTSAASIAIIEFLFILVSFSVFQKVLLMNVAFSICLS